MQNLFSQYELRNAVDFLVAPISGICHPGYNYLQIFAQLHANPAMLPNELAHVFLDTAGKNRKPSHKDFLPDIRQTWKIHTVQLNQEALEKIQRLFSNLMEQVFILQQTDRKALYCLRLANRQLFNYAIYSLPEIKMVDLTVLLEFWATKIQQFASLQSLLNPIQELQQVLNEMFTDVFVGDLFYHSDFHFVDEDLITPHKKTGFGLWFPHKAPRKENMLFNEILHPGKLKDMVPTFVRDTRYADVFNEFIACYG